MFIVLVYCTLFMNHFFPETKNPDHWPHLVGKDEEDLLSCRTSQENWNTDTFDLVRQPNNLRHIHGLQWQTRPLGGSSQLSVVQAWWAKANTRWGLSTGCRLSQSSLCSSRHASFVSNVHLKQNSDGVAFTILFTYFIINLLIYFIIYLLFYYIYLLLII